MKINKIYILGIFLFLGLFFLFGFAEEAFALTCSGWEKTWDIYYSCDECFDYEYCFSNACWVWHSNTCPSDFGCSVINECQYLGYTCDGYKCSSGQSYRVNNSCTGLCNSGQCSGGSCVPACECTSGICCDGCDYRSSTYTCDWDDELEYGCPWGTGLGDDAGWRIRSKARYCSGSNSSCDGSWGSWSAWSAWYIEDFCSSSEYCSGGVCVVACECTSGACCDGCNFKSYGSQPTGDFYDDTYSCEGTNGAAEESWITLFDYYCNGTDIYAHVNKSRIDTCGTCEYCLNNETSCRYYSAGTSCGTNKECDGSGNCLDLNCAPPTGTISASKTEVIIGETFTISITGYDDHDVWYISSNEGSNIWNSTTEKKCSFTQTECTREWNYTKSTAGTYTYYGRVRDSDDNHGCSSWHEAGIGSVTVTVNPQADTKIDCYFGAATCIFDKGTVTVNEKVWVCGTLRTVGGAAIPGKTISLWVRTNGSYDKVFDVGTTNSSGSVCKSWAATDDLVKYDDPKYIGTHKYVLYFAGDSNYNETQTSEYNLTITCDTTCSAPGAVGGYIAPLHCTTCLGKCGWICYRAAEIPMGYATACTIGTDCYFPIYPYTIIDNRGTSCSGSVTKCQTSQCPNYSGWDGEGCTTRKTNCSHLLYGSYGVVNYGKWDASDRKCVQCDANYKEIAVCGDTSGIYLECNYGERENASCTGTADNKCESACGADSFADEQPPNSCSLVNCGYGNSLRLDCYTAACATYDGPCSSSCGAIDPECNGKNPNDFCGVGGTCDDSCKCIEACTRANPSVSLSPSSQEGNPGDTKSYTATITNNDNAACGSSTFNLTKSCPSGWSCSLSSSSKTISPGSSTSVTLSVTSPDTVTAGNYTVSVTATNSAATSYSGTGSATYQIVILCTRANPAVSISPSSQSGNPGQTLSYTVTIINYDSSDCGSSTFNLTKSCPSGWTCSLSASSVTVSPDGSSNAVSLSVTSPSTATAGNYTVSVTATNSAATSYSGTGSATYTVTVEAACGPGETEVVMDNFPSDGATVTQTVNAPSGEQFTAGTISTFHATGDLNTCSSEYFNAYVENNQINANYCTGYQDCTYHQVDSNVGITSYISGKTSFQLKVISSAGTDAGFTCPGTAIKVKWCLDLTSGPACTRVNPGVSLSPSSQSGSPGDTLSYTATIINYDSAGCGSSTFNLTKSCPSGWTCSLSSTSITISPDGSSNAVSLSVTSPTTATAGNYTVSVTATNSAATSYSGTDSATYQVVIPCTRADPTVTLSPSSQSGSPGDTKSYTATITNNDSSACGSSTFNLTKSCPSGWTCSLSSSSKTISPGSSDSVILDITSPTTATAGNYTVSVTATNSAATSYSGTGSATYAVTVAAACTPGETEVIMDNFPSDGVTVTQTVNAPSGEQFTAGTISTFHATGDLNTCSSEYFNAYVEGSQINANYCTGYQDCTYHQVDSNVGITSHISGKTNFELKVISSAGTDAGFTCPGTAIKVKWCLDLTSGPACTRANPGVSLSPSSQSGSPGESKFYTATITNNDNSACGSSTFNLTKSCPSGWTCSLSSTSITISPNGSAGSVSLSVTSPTTATAGNYTVSVTATNSAATSYSGTGSATYTVIVEAACAPGETEVIMDNFPSDGATITQTVNAPSGEQFTGGTITKFFATGDTNSCTSEYFNAYVEGSQINANYCTGYQDCTYHQVDSNVGITSYISGKTNFELKVISSAGTDVGNTCPGTAIKVKWCLDLSSEVPTYTLTVTTTGTGSGTVTSSPAGINCGADCSESYSDGASVTLTATPDSGSYFAGWSGDCLVEGVSLEDDFEIDFGNWSNITGDDIDWTRKSGSTSSSSTGPPSAYGGSYYIYTESSSPNYPDKTAILRGLQVNASNMHINFYYHMYGSTMGSLYLEVSTDGGSNWTSEWSKSGNQGDSWYNADIDLSSYNGETIDIRFRGVTGSSFTSDMALDDVNISGGGGGDTCIVTMDSDKSVTATFDLADTTPPTTTIKIIRTSTGEDVTVAGYWLRADTYTIEFEDKDQADGSGLNCESCSCEYSVYACDVGGVNCTTTVTPLTSRSSNWSFQITAGKTAPAYNLEGVGRYRIYSGARDMVNYSATEYRYINFDFTPPKTEIR